MPVEAAPGNAEAPFAAFPDVVQYQIIYDGRALAVRLVPRAGGSADVPEQVRSALTRALREAGATPPLIAVIPVPAIDREPGHAGKYKLIKLVP